jgi:hypothetical protein
MSSQNSNPINFYSHFEYKSIHTNIFDEFNIDNVVIIEEAIKQKESDILPKYYTKLYLLPSDVRIDFVRNEIERTADTLANIDFYFNEVLMSAYFNEEDFYSPEDIAFSWLDTQQLSKYREFNEDSFNILISKDWDSVTLPKFSEIIIAITNIRYLVMLKWHWSLLKKGKQIIVKDPVTHITHSLNENQLLYLYKSFTQELDLINEFKTSYSDFKDVFNLGFNETDSKIHWTGETKQVAYLLGLLKKTAEYTYVSIEKSRKFITKDNTILTATNISKGISDSKGMRPKDDKLIKDILDKIPK